MKKNQVIVREAVLPYRGKMILKDWESVKRHAGKKVRITIGHPQLNLITKKFMEGDQVGKTTLSICPNSKALCADIPADHKYKGYSIGYAYRETDEKGVHDNANYNAKRYVDEIDHIALVDDPRDPKITADSLSVATDSFTDGKSYVNIYPEIGIGIDSYFFPVKMENEIDVKYMGNDNNDGAGDNTDYKKLAIDRQSEIDSLNQKLKDTLIREISHDIDRLENTHNFNPDVFKGKTGDFIKGAIFASDALKDAYEQGHSSATEMAGDGQPDVDVDDINLHNLKIGEDGKLAFDL